MLEQIAADFNATRIGGASPRPPGPLAVRVPTEWLHVFDAVSGLRLSP